MVPETLQEWITLMERRLHGFDAAPRGTGRRAWRDAVVGAGFVVEEPFRPGWRWLNDGRVELRGRVRKVSGSVGSGDVLLYLPYDCAPPNNKDLPPSSVSVVGPATIGSGGSGVCRYDVQREAAWRVDGEGRPVSRVEVIARPGGGSIGGWVGFDHVMFDPRLYVDALPAVPKGMDPLVPNPGIAVVQQPGGAMQQFSPGVLS